MIGQKCGVATQVSKKYPSIVTWHYLNYRFELAVGEAADDTHGVNHFRSFLDSLYTLYSRSYNTQKQLETTAHDLDIHLKKIGRVLNTKWVASSFRTVKAVWDNFEALAAHFKSAPDPSCEQFEAASTSKYSGLLNTVHSSQFVFITVR